MRSILFATAAAVGLFAIPAGAQTGSTQSPPSPGAASQMPQPPNSLPAGGLTGTQPSPGSNLGGTVTAPPPAMAPRRPMGQMEHRQPSRPRPVRQAIPPQTSPASVDDQAAPPTSAYRGGAGSPLSAQAANLNPGRPEQIGSRLPEPTSAGNTPRDLLAAADRELARGRTGAAQEALERAETRILSRTTDPAMAAQPDQAGMVQNIAQARRALGARDTKGARAAIAAAMKDNVPAPGPATTTIPGSAPTGRAF